MASSFMRMNVASRIGLGIGVTFSKGIKVIVIFYQLVTIPFKFPLDLFLLSRRAFFVPYPLLQAGVPGLL